MFGIKATALRAYDEKHLFWHTVGVHLKAESPNKVRDTLNGQVIQTCFVVSDCFKPLAACSALVSLLFRDSVSKIAYQYRHFEVVEWTIKPVCVAVYAWGV